MSKPPIEFVSCFAGSGGFDLGFENTGRMQTVMQVEIVGHRRNTLARHFPHVTNLQGDIRDVRADSITGNPDLFPAGFPCKQLSVAAPHRQGLDGKDSKLLFEFYRLVGAYLDLVAYARPRFVVLENTPGLLRSRKGRDMAAVVMGLEELGYGWAYRVVNGASLGTPQERRRVVIVGHLGGDPRPAGSVLGLDGSGGEVAPTGADRRPGPGPHARPVVVGGEVVKFWRKSANSQVSIDLGYEGGYRETWVNDGRMNTLASADGGNATRQKHLLFQHGRLRTLTPVEWERASGFPDGWTDNMPHTERMKAMGDTFHVGTAQWLGERLVAVNDSLAAHPRIFDAPAQERAEVAAEVGGQLALFG